jgi:PAS domain S-box-containing protein
MGESIENVMNELMIVRKSLAQYKIENEKLSISLNIANRELTFQKEEKRKRAAELAIADIELAFQDEEKVKRANELGIANIELAFQDKEKGKRAAELGIANIELAFQDEEKGKRAEELIIANIELAYQDEEKGKRAEELIIANIELAFQNEEKEKRNILNKELEAIGYSAKLASQYTLSLIEASRDPLVTISPEGKITDMNEATVSITGITRNKLRGTDFFDYFTEPQKAREVYQEVFAKGSVADSPLTLRHKNGKLTDVLFNGSVYKDDRENVLGVVIVARDVTEQKRIATELTEAKVFAELATSIAEEAQSNAELATRIAEDAVKAKQQFLSNMSHEIRTPMNAIIGFTKVVLRTDLTIKQKEYLQAIKMSGDALIVLINDILDLAKVDAGKMTFEQTPFKLALSISAMLHLFETKIQEKNLNLIKVYDQNIPEVLVGDPVRLHQIILNLVSNAVKFTTVGNITVSVRLLEEDGDHVKIEFAVTDTGIGILETKIIKIFENFQQASSGTSRLYGGTGLGLAIVKQLVESQGGTIDVKSNMGEGSTFSFVLDFKKTNAEADLDPSIEEFNNEIKNIKILVVEDIALNQLLMKTLLDDFGFERDIASNGIIAIEKLQLKSYDIILMDLQMPQMNGFEATEYVRNTMNSNIPIIALTADVTTVDLAKCKAVGMNDYIAKPIDERLLYSKIVSLVKKKAVNHEVVDVLGLRTKRCIDLGYLHKRTKSNKVLMMEMITLYLEQTPTLIEAMNEGVKEKNWNLLKSAVHKMIPSFSIMGIHNDFEKMARQIQEFVNHQEQEETIHSLVKQLSDVCFQACSELEEEFNLLKIQTHE